MFMMGILILGVCFGGVVKVVVVLGKVVYDLMVGCGMVVNFFGFLVDEK